MNRIVEDRLLLDECEKAFMSLNDTARKNGVKSSVLDGILNKIKMHREKFTRRILDKEKYIMDNKASFDLIYENDSHVVMVSGPEQTRNYDANKSKKEIYADLVTKKFYSAATSKNDVIRSLMRTYKKMFGKQKKEK